MSAPVSFAFVEPLRQVILRPVVFGNVQPWLVMTRLFGRLLRKHGAVELRARASLSGQTTSGRLGDRGHQDRKSTRLNSSHGSISYAVFCLKKKKATHCRLSPKQYKKASESAP